MSRARSKKRLRFAEPAQRDTRRLFFESLEERRVLSTIAVTSAFVGQLTLTDLNDLAAKNDSLAMSFNAGKYEFQQGGDAVLNLPVAIPGISLAGGKLTVDPALFGDFDIEMLNVGDSVAVNSVGPTPLSSLKIVNGATQIGTDVSTTGDQTYDSDVSLTADVQLAGANVVFHGKVDGNAHSLDVIGNAVFGNAAADSVTGVTTLLVNDTAEINASVVSTANDQTYNDAVVVGADTTFTSTGGGNVTFAGTITGAVSVAINTAGTTRFQGHVGVASLTTDAAGTTVLDINSVVAVSTTGDQTFNDPVTLAININLASSTGGNITFASTVNGAHDLTSDTSGTVTFGGAVGGTTALTQLRTKGLGITAINGGNVTTTGKQRYDEAVTLGANTAITIAATEIVTFSSTINGAFSLSVDTLNGIVQFGGAIGNTTPLASLTTVATKAEIFGGSVVTTGAQAYNDIVTIGNDTQVRSTGAGGISFVNDVAGAFSLSINTAGTTTLKSPGAGSVLASVTTDAPGATVLTGTMLTTGSQTYNDSVTLGANTTLTSSGSGNIQFGSTINGAFGLAINTTGMTTFSGAVGGTTPLTSLTTDTVGSTAINGGTVTTTGAQTYNDAVVLGLNAVLTSTGAGNITFASTLNGAFSLTVNTAGMTTFGGVVGGGTFLAGLTTNAGGSTHIDGGQISAAVQTYNDAVVLGADTTVNATAGITFNSTVDGGFNLQSFDMGATTFNATVGGITPLANLILNADGTTHIDADITTTGNHSFLNQVFIQNAVTHVVTLKGNFVQFLNLSSLNGEVAGESLTIVAAAGIPFNGVVGNTQPLKNLTVTANNGEISAAGNISTTGDLQFSATETVVPTTNNVTIVAGVIVQAANIRFAAGDSILVSGNLTANAGTMKIDLVSLDDVGVADAAAAGTTTTGSLIAVTGKLTGQTITITGSSQDDDINLNLAGVTSANPVTIDAGAGDLSRTANIRKHGIIALGRPYFQPGINSDAGNIDDQVTLDDVTFVPAVPAAVVKYVINGNQILRDGVAKVTYASIEQLGLKAGANHNDIIVNMGAGLPNLLQLDGGGGSDNRFQVIGTAAADDISIGDNPSTLIVGGVPLHAQFELKNLNRMWVQGLGGNDTIDNISHVPALLDGGVGDDVINNIVADPNSKFTLNSKKIAQSVPREVSLVLGKLGSDKLFTGAGIRDNSQPANALTLALKSFSDTGITFLIGDYQEMKVGGIYKFSLVADANNPAIHDGYSSSSGVLRHGFITIGKDNPAQGIFAYGGGTSIKFSNTISWLKAQIFVKAALTDLLTALAKQVSFYEGDVKPGLGEAPPEEPDSSGTIPALSAAMDVDHDGEITPLDALLIINDVNTRGSHAAPLPSLDDSGANSLDGALNFDLDLDGEVAPVDSLLVINALNLLSEGVSDGSADVAMDVVEAGSTESGTVPSGTNASWSQAAYSSHDMVMLLLSSNSQSQRRVI